MHCAFIWEKERKCSSQALYIGPNRHVIYREKIRPFHFQHRFLNSFSFSASSSRTLGKALGLLLQTLIRSLLCGPLLQPKQVMMHCAFTLEKERKMLKRQALYNCPQIRQFHFHHPHHHHHHHHQVHIEASTSYFNLSDGIERKSVTR